MDIADRVVGLDPSLTGTGLATATEIRTCGSDREEAGSLDYLRRFRAIWADLWQTLRTVDGPIVAVEGIVKPQHASGIHTTGLHYFLRDRMHRHSIPFVDVPPTQVKKYALGKGGGKNTGKVDMILAARTRLGYEGNDDNQADALWLRALLADATGAPLVAMPKVNREVVSVVAKTVPKGVVVG